ncbi:hypothetical protein V6Z11_D10G157300 [Gossypium hirsutum]
MMMLRSISFLSSANKMLCKLDLIELENQFPSDNEEESPINAVLWSSVSPTEQCLKENQYPPRISTGETNKDHCSQSNLPCTINSYNSPNGVRSLKPKKHIDLKL